MIRVFWGEDRLEAEKAVKRLLGVDYEVFEGENLSPQDLPSVFQGTSLFGTGVRKILLKDLTENTAVWEKVGDYLETEHEVVIWEKKVDKRSVVYKKMVAAGVEMQEFAEKKGADTRVVFGILETALRDGVRAVKMVEQIEMMQDPYMFFGLMVTQALKRFEAKPGVKEKRILKRLAKLDMQMKTTGMEPWMLIRVFLMEVGRL